MNSYAASKAAASIALRQWAEEKGAYLEILRLFHVYGEVEPEGRLWPTLRNAAAQGYDVPMTWGEQVRDFIAVEEVVKVFLQRAAYLPRKITIKQYLQHWQRPSMLRSLFFGELLDKMGGIR